VLVIFGVVKDSSNFIFSALVVKETETQHHIPKKNLNPKVKIDVIGK